MNIQRLPLMSALAVAALLSVAACDGRRDDRTVGQKADTTIAKAEQKTEQAATEVKKDVGQAMDTAGSKIKDGAITTGVNAKLAADKSLSALKIDVDTSNGRVVLHGTAPDAGARDRATQLASAVDGVVSVDNQLKVASK